ARLEPTPSRLITAAFVPRFDRVEVAIDPDSGNPQLAPSCLLLDDGSAWGPAYRLPAATRIHLPICQGYDISLGAIGYVLGTWLLEPPNLPGPGYSWLTSCPLSCLQLESTMGGLWPPTGRKGTECSTKPS